MFKKILLGVDGSHYSLKAAEMAAALARCMQADLHVVVAHATLPAYFAGPSVQHTVAIESARLKDSRDILDKAVQTIGEVPGTLKTEMLEGPAAEVILQVAERIKSDLIVMGSRGLGNLRGLLIGSQSHKVLQHAPCPVMIVR